MSEINNNRLQFERAFGQSLMVNYLQKKSPPKDSTQFQQMSWLLPLAKINNIPCNSEMKWEDLLMRISTNFIKRNEHK